MSKRLGMCAAGERVDAALEPLHPTFYRGVLPDRLEHHARDFRCLPRAIRGALSQGHGGGRIRGIGPDELIERRGQELSTRRRTQHRVDAGQVVVHPAAVDTDDVPQRLLHRLQSASGDAEGLAQVAEVVVVAGARDRVEKWADGIGKILVHVCVRPLDAPGRVSRDDMRSTLASPVGRFATAVIGRDWTIQSRASASIVHSMSWGRSK